MTSIETEATPELNGADPPALDDGVEYLPNGTARFTVSGKVYTLHPPTIGMFKRLHAHWVALAEKPAGEQLEGQLAWVLLLFNGNADVAGLSDKRLDEGDTDDWPAWLGVAAYQLKLMTHFRDVPLARGGPVLVQ